MAALDFENVIDCAESKINLSDLASWIEVDVSTLRRYISGKIEPSFLKYYKMAKRLGIKDNEIIEGCHKQTEPKNIKSAMEFFALNKRLDDLSNLITHSSKGTLNQSLKKWCQVYSLILDYENNPYNHKNFLENIAKINSKEIELTLLIKLVQANSYYRMISDVGSKRYEIISLCEDVEKKLSEVKDDFLRKSFEIRLNDLLSKVFLQIKVNTKEARLYASKNLNQDICPLFQANALYTVSTSFLFESYEEAIKYVKLSIDRYKDASYTHFANELERSAIPFINAVFGVKCESDDVSETAHFEARWGDKNKAAKILQELSNKGKLSMYKSYYLALATGNEELLFESFLCMLKAGDNFFAKLPLKDLEESQSFALASKMVYEKFITQGDK